VDQLEKGKGTLQDAGTSGKDVEVETKEIEQDHEEPLSGSRVSEESPFIVIRRDTTAVGKWKKQKAVKPKGIETLFLIDGDTDKIKEKV